MYLVAWTNSFVRVVSYKRKREGVERFLPFFYWAILTYEVHEVIINLTNNNDLCRLFCTCKVISTEISNANDNRRKSSLS
jgi:hypothetical protein